MSCDGLDADPLRRPASPHTVALQCLRVLDCLQAVSVMTPDWSKIGWLSSLNFVFMWVLTVSVVFGSYLLPWTSTLLLTESIILGVQITAPSVQLTLLIYMFRGSTRLPVYFRMRGFTTCSQWKKFNVFFLCVVFQVACSTNCKWPYNCHYVNVVHS